MDVLAEASAIIKTAEIALRELMQKAVLVGDYRDLPTLARMGESLSGMTTRIGGSEPPLGLPSGAVSKSPRAPITRKKSKQVPKSKPMKEYPRFKREGARLVKIGWSKSDRSEYQHRISRSVGHALLTAVNKLSKTRQVFAVEDLLPLTEPVDNIEVPPHQVYLALAWLRAEGIVLPKGREGYTLLVNEEPSKLFEDRWNALPVR